MNDELCRLLKNKNIYQEVPNRGFLLRQNGLTFASFQAYAPWNEEMELSSSHNFAFDFGSTRTLNLVASLVIQWIRYPPQTTDFNMSKVYRLMEGCHRESDCDGESAPHGKGNNYGPEALEVTE